MKNSILIVAAIALGLFISCDNAAMLNKMKAEQEAAVDSLVNVQLGDLRTELMADCDEQYNLALKEAVDTRIAEINGKATPAMSKPIKPKPVVTPTPKPTPPPKTDPSKSRGNASSGTVDQKSRGNAIPGSSGSSKASGTPITKEQVEKQKSRGRATKKD